MNKITRLPLILSLVVAAFAVTACGDSSPNPSAPKTQSASIASLNAKAERAADASASSLVTYYSAHHRFPAKAAQIPDAKGASPIAQASAKAYVTASGPNNNDTYTYVYLLTPQRTVVCHGSKGDTNYCWAVYGMPASDKKSYGIGQSSWAVKGPNNAIPSTVKLDFDSLGFLKAPPGWTNTMK